MPTAKGNGQNRVTQRGLGIDSLGGPVVDPTANVIALNEAATKRQDDLRIASEKLTEAKINALSQLVNLRAEHAKEMNEAESRRVDEQLALRAEYAERLSIAEAKRIDAIRAVDVNAVSVASQRASDQATVLATQLAQSAEGSRSLVASTANTVAQSQQQLANTLSARITTLEQAQYEGKGKSTYTDPVLAELTAEMKSFRLHQSQVAGKSQGVSAVWGYIVAVIGILIAAFALFKK